MTYDVNSPEENMEFFRHYLNNITKQGARPHQYISDCPSCKSQGKFALNLESGLFICNSCRISGNRKSFLGKIGKEEGSENGNSEIFENPLVQDVRKMTIPIDDEKEVRVKFEVVRRILMSKSSLN